MDMVVVRGRGYRLDRAWWQVRAWIFIQAHSSPQGTLKNEFASLLAFKSQCEHGEVPAFLLPLSRMPAATVTCPHCEKPVEIQVAAVTRSRTCPECSQTIMLQVAGQARHKAVLMSAKPSTDQFSKPDLNEDSGTLPGDAFERMCMDPELTQTRRQLVWGGVGVLACSLIAVVIHLQGIKLWPKKAAEPPPIAETASLSQPPAMAAAPELLQQPEIKSVPKKISFRSASGENPSETQAVEVRDEAKAVLEKFLAADSVEAKLALAYDPARVGPMMKSYYQQHSARALSYSHVERVEGVKSYDEFCVVLRDGSKKFAAVLSTPDGPRVDWASLISYGDMEWEQMRKARPSQPVLMRVLASDARQYRGAFSDAVKLRCVRLVPASDPSAVPVYGYVPLESDLGRRLGLWLARNDKAAVPLTLKLCYPGEIITPDQAWITEVVTPGWVLLNTSSREAQ
jgi:hypothetical protein